MADHREAAGPAVVARGGEGDRRAQRLGRLGDRAYHQERQAGGRGNLGDGVALGVERRREGGLEGAPLGAGRGQRLVAAGDARDAQVELAAAEPAQQGRAPGGIGRDRPPARGHHALGDHHVARPQHRREADREAEADQRIRALRPQLLGALARAQPAAAADPGERRSVRCAAAQALRLGLQPHDHAEPRGPARGVEPCRRLAHGVRRRAARGDGACRNCLMLRRYHRVFPLRNDRLGRAGRVRDLYHRFNIV